MSELYTTRLPDKMGELVIAFNGDAMDTTERCARILCQYLRTPEQVAFDQLSTILKDLSWLPEKTITLVIYNYEKLLMLSRDDVADFRQLLSDVTKYWNQNGEKNVDIVAIEDSAVWSQMMGSAALYPVMNAEWNKEKPRYSVSLPVLRWDKKELVLAYWIAARGTVDEETGESPRPQMWCTANMLDNDMVSQYHCSDREFCNMSANANISWEFKRDVEPLSKAWWNTTWTLLSMVRMYYLRDKVVHMHLYQEYLQRLLDATPEDLQPLYQQLSM